MKLTKYAKQIDSIEYRSDFEADTISKLKSARENKDHGNSFLLTKRTAIIAAAAIILTATVGASLALLTADKAAQHIGDEKLSQAFKTDDAVHVNKSIKTADYNITLLGLISGSNISSFCKVDKSRTYAVISVASTDGTPYTNDFYPDLAFTPLVSGFKPWQLNAWYLGGGYTEFCDGGLLYYVFDCDDISCFADRTIYFAVYEGGVPNNTTFDIADNGSISFAKDFDKASALFTLPIDKKLADSEKAQKLIVDCGIKIE